jgi:hypothetical protein
MTVRGPRAQLIFIPRSPAVRPCIARPEWGAPTAVGSAARIQKLCRAAASASAAAVAGDGERGVVEPPAKRPREGQR